ncbi:polysaccharide pyruvyl transferase family protein [Pseudomonadota bacterium]
MKITFITTVQHNIGDDFVREGLKHILSSVLGENRVQFTDIHKHSPITSRHGFEWLRSKRIGLQFDRMLPLSLTTDRILDADLVVQSGAPVFWHHDHDQFDVHCADNEWCDPLIKRRFSQVRDKGVKFFNLAAGACQQYHSEGSEFLSCKKCSSYINWILQVADVTTLRDELSSNILASYGLQAPVIPCSSLFAPESLSVTPREGEYVALNYMQGAGHYAFQQGIDVAQHQAAFKALYEDLIQREQVVLVCHDSKEKRWARSIAPDAKIFSAGDDYRKYVEFYARAKYGVVNRVHAAFIMAALGKPSLVIGNDSRARMANQIGLKSLFVNDATPDLLISNSVGLSKMSSDYADMIHHIKDDAFNAYIKAISQEI